MPILSCSDCIATWKGYARLCDLCQGYPVWEFDGEKFSLVPLDYAVLRRPANKVRWCSFRSSRWFMVRDDMHEAGWRKSGTVGHAGALPNVNHVWLGKGRRAAAREGCEWEPVHLNAATAIRKMRMHGCTVDIDGTTMQVAVAAPPDYHMLGALRAGAPRKRANVDASDHYGIVVSTLTRNLARSYSFPDRAAAKVERAMPWTRQPPAALDGSPRLDSFPESERLASGLQLLSVPVVMAHRIGLGKLELPMVRIRHGVVHFSGLVLAAPG